MRSLSAFALFTVIAMTLSGLGCPGFAALAYEGYTVCIDPGHQGVANSTPEPIGPGATTTKPCVSSGTSGPISGPEHALNLDVGLRLRDLLAAQGVTVVMTRTTPDVDLCNSERAAIANAAEAHLAVRIHANSGSTSGCFTLNPTNIPGWTDDIYEESLEAATIVQTAFAAHTGIPDLGLTPRSDIAGFNWSDVPVILPEMFHMQNAEHDALAATPAFRQLLAEGLAEGIFAYLDTVDSVPVGLSLFGP
ncbi:N-acetylmuramoyl-L-alanine amidase [Candidatus Sumerlaeota bacterium]|nr:N-acetylmuramoyl-L-alanine amidase [Candidatus Sumerlaeota bacterium]